MTQQRQGASATHTTGSLTADPHAELPIKNFKYVKNCTELYLAQRNIEKLAHFEDFVNLEVLWLNDNRIESLDGLDACVRIKELYAQNNRIRSILQSSLTKFKFLKTLRLNNNKLRDLQAAIDVLENLHHLEDLDLYGNPLGEEDSYRLHIIRAIPSLNVLDRHAITDEERATARRLHNEPNPAPRRPKQASKKPVVVPGAPPQELSSSVKMLFREVDSIKRTQEAARRAEAEKEVARMRQDQQALTICSNCIKGSKQQLREPPGVLDTWEMADLEKVFCAMEDKPHAGIPHAQFKKVLQHLADRGYQVKCHGQVLKWKETSEIRAEDIQAGFPQVDPRVGEARISFKQLRESLVSDRLQCQMMTPAELKQRSEDHFAHALAIEKQIEATTSSHSSQSDDVQHQTMDMHNAIQRGYRLASLAEKVASDPLSGDAQTERSSIPSKTRFFATSFVRESSPSAKFNDIEEQCARIDPRLAAKYRVQQKDFQKYMKKQAPQDTKLVRRQFNL